MRKKEESKGFRIAARALRQLGAELITSDDVALNELIKNSFDALSPRVSIEISSSVDLSALELLEEKIRKKQVTKTEAQERVEKSIAADLSPQARAALIKEMFANIDEPSTFLAYLQQLRLSQSIKINDTGIGMSDEELKDRFLVIGTPGKFIEKQNSKKGDRPILGEKGIGRLSMMRLGNFALVRSKKEKSTHWNEIRFKWDEFDDPELDLGEVEIKVTPGASAPEADHGTEIEIRQLVGNWSQDKVKDFIHQYMRRLQNPFNKDRRPYPVDIKLNGKRQPIAALPDWLRKCAQFEAEFLFDPKGIDGTTQVLRRSLRWRGTTSSEFRSWEIGELTQQLGVPQETFLRLGEFTANCLWFNRRLLVSDGVDYSKTQIRDELNHWCGGFALYRNDFRIGKTGGMDDDWLEWDSGALKTQGFAMNRYQTIGSISISSDTNPHLVDSANRESLVACPEQELLTRLFKDIVVVDLRSHINAVQEAELKIALAEDSTTASLDASEDNLKKTIRNVEEIGKLLPKEQRHKIVEIREALQGQVEYVKVIQNSLELAREKRIELLELANIGLVVEIVIHELARLTQRTGELLVDLEKNNNEADLIKVVDNLRTQIVATNKRIRTVDAMSPAGRQRKDEYDIAAQVKNVASGFENRFERHNILHTVSMDGSTKQKPLVVKMVKGLVSQTLENLLTNSVYWLQQGVMLGDNERKIDIEIDSKALTISVRDNGPGIDPRYAKEIFKPYYTTRKKGKGLGLYIAAELVDYHGGKLYLDEAPEKDGRLRTFVIELPRE